MEVQTELILTFIIVLFSCATYIVRHIVRILQIIDYTEYEIKQLQFSIHKISSDVVDKNQNHLNKIEAKLIETLSQLTQINAKNEIFEQKYEHDIDQFIETFTVYTNIAPSLLIIFMCWCVYTKQWFTRDSIVEFTIINSLGEENIITVQNNNHFIALKQLTSTDDSINITLKYFFF